MYNIGSVILIERQIFNDGDSLTKIDHALRRPSVVIAEDEKNFYYLTLTSKNKKYSNNIEIYDNQNRRSYVKLDSIYQKPIYGAIEKSYLPDEQLLFLLTEFYNYNKKNENSVFKKIEKIILKEIKDITLKMSKKAINKK